VLRRPVFGPLVLLARRGCRSKVVATSSTSPGLAGSVSLPEVGIEVGPTKAR
jgi:hypothetical protein